MIKPLYISRPLMNGEQLLYWAEKKGYKNLLEKPDFHVTVACSRNPVDWDTIRQADPYVINYLVIDESSTDRRVLSFTDAIVLSFQSNILYRRWKYLKYLGCSWDFPDYQSHVSLTYDMSNGIDSTDGYEGRLIFGPERWEEWIEK